MYRPWVAGCLAAKISRHVAQPLRHFDTAAIAALTALDLLAPLFADQHPGAAGARALRQGTGLLRDCLPPQQHPLRLPHRPARRPHNHCPGLSAAVPLRPQALAATKPRDAVAGRRAGFAQRERLALARCAGYQQRCFVGRWRFLTRRKCQ